MVGDGWVEVLEFVQEGRRSLKNQQIIKTFFSILFNFFQMPFIYQVLLPEYLSPSREGGGGGGEGCSRQGVFRCFLILGSGGGGGGGGGGTCGQDISTKNKYF